MASGRCRSCGGDLPADARFCPRCGTGLDEVPLLPLLDAEEQPAPAGSDGEGRRASKGMRTVLVLVAGLVVLVLGLGALSGGDDGDGGAEGVEEAVDESSPPTEDRRSNSTTPRSTSTTVAPLLEEGGHPAAAGAAVLHASGDQLVVADLGTGRQIEVPGPGHPVTVLVVHGDDILVQTDVGTAYLMDFEDPGRWIEAGAGVDLAWGSEAGTGLLIVDEYTVGAFDDRGTLTTWGLPPGGEPWSARGRVGDEVVVNAYDGAFLVDRDGRARRLSHGVALAANGREVLVVVCDDSLRCNPVLVDAGASVVKMLPGLPEGFAIESATISPAGTEVVLAGHRWDGGVLERALFRANEGGWTRLTVTSGWSVAGAVWVDDSGSSVWWAHDTNTIEVLPPDGEPVSLRLPLGARNGWGTVAVTTLDSLPEEWRELLSG